MLQEKSYRDKNNNFKNHDDSLKVDEFKRKNDIVQNNNVDKQTLEDVNENHNTNIKSKIKVILEINYKCIDDLEAIYFLDKVNPPRAKSVVSNISKKVNHIPALNFDFNNEKENKENVNNNNNNNANDIKKNQEIKLNKQSLVTSENQSLNNSKSLSQIHKIKNMKSHFSSVNMNHTNNNVVTEILNKNMNLNLANSGIYKNNNTSGPNYANNGNNGNLLDNTLKLSSKYKIK